MRLDDTERAMRAGRMGPARQAAIEQQIQVGRTFDAQDFVRVSQVHLMADTESLGESGVEFIEAVAALPEEQRRVRVPTVTDPRGIDLCAYRRLNQQERFAALERRAIAAFESMGILMTDTCINYQTILPPVRGEHLAFGDTGSTIYANSVCGARSNFEGGPAALAAALTGRVPRYGCHLDGGRRGTHLFHVRKRPESLSDWGALGAIVDGHLRKLREQRNGHRRDGDQRDPAVVEDHPSQHPEPGFDAVSQELRHLGSSPSSGTNRRPPLCPDFGFSPAVRLRASPSPDASSPPAWPPGSDRLQSSSRRPVTMW